MDKIIGTFKKIQYNSPVILTFSLLSFLALLLGLATSNQSTDLLFSVYKGSFADAFFYIRLFGHVLGHISYQHFFNNFVIILLAGPLLEEKYGSKNMCIMILVTAFVTGIINALFFDVQLLGASGIVFMFILLSSFVNLEKGKIPLTLILCIFIYLGTEIFSGLTVDDNVAHLTHIIGGICGASFGFLMNKRKIID